jgi:hypothetical protein
VFEPPGGPLVFQAQLAGSGSRPSGWRGRPPGGHPAGKIARTSGHVATPVHMTTSPLQRWPAPIRCPCRAILRRRCSRLVEEDQLGLPPVLLFGLAAAVVLAAGAFGASVLRTPPHGSEETLASGIFFSVSL